MSKSETVIELGEIVKPAHYLNTYYKTKYDPLPMTHGLFFSHQDFELTNYFCHLKKDQNQNILTKIH